MLLPQTRVGPYEVLGSLGAGGMGEVYRARDHRLQRDVALKVLSTAMAGDADRLARFRREAQVLASLNHPHIAHLHGLEEVTPDNAPGAAPLPVLVMELVEGEDLSQRISQGAMPIEEALAIARQIAEALDAAHSAGIVHRDLKPANVKIREDGTAKVLDFGLAKLGTTDASGASGAEFAMTMTSPAMTQAGIILGTAAYMSPEQARGKSVDKRADIWAFGCVLYEMLTGRHAFGGDTVTDVLGAIVKSEPDWSALPSNTPASIRALLRRCLQKDPSKRLRDIGDTHAELAGAVVEEPGSPGERRTGSLVSRLLPWAVAFAALATTGATWITRGAEPADRPVRTLQVDKGAGIVSPVIAPDGQRVVYVRDGRLVVRRLDEVEGREIADTEDAANPFWSDDSRSIGYFAQGAPIQLRLVSVEDGSQRVVASGPTSGRVTGENQTPFAPRGGAACGDAVYFIVFGRGLMRVSGGSPPTLVASLDAGKGETNWAYPSCLPDGRLLAVLEAKTSTPTSNTTLTVIDGDRRIPLLENARAPVFARPNHIVFERVENARVSIWTVPVNGDLTATTGPATQLIAGTDPSVARDGTLVALTGVEQVDRQLVWTDRSGARLSLFGRPQRRPLDPAIAPDGTRVAVESDGRIWLHYESAVREFGEEGLAPAWSPDGQFLAYFKAGNVMMRAVDGATPARVLAEGSTRNFAWAPDGRSLVVSQAGGLTLVSMDKPSEPQQLLTNAGYPAISPDGRLLAYVAFAMDRDEVFLTTFPKPGPVWPVSVGGGRRPRWNPKGGELFFTGGPRVGEDPNSHRDLFVARIDTRNGVTVEPPVRLFDASARGLVISSQSPRTYDVAPDGQRLIVSTDGWAGTPTITLIDRLDAFMRARR